MLQLYTSPSCPYCRLVEAHLAERSIAYEPHDVAANQADRDFVIQEGGKMQIPFLYDTEREEKLYESADIITYINDHYESQPTEASAGK